MKKLFAAILTAALMGLGFVGASTSSASAVTSCGYTACIGTTTLASTKSAVKVGKKGKVTAGVVAPGNAKPSGTIKVVVRGPQGFKKVIEVPFAGNGGAIKIKTGRLFKKGNYTAVVTFQANVNGIFESSKDKSSFTVR